MYRLLHALVRKNSSWFWTKPHAPSYLFLKRLSHLLNGPDQIIPSKDLYTTRPDGYVQLRQGEGVAALPPISIPGLLHSTAVNHPDTIALVSKNDAGEFKSTTYRQFEEEVRICAKAFIKLGLQRYNSVCIIGYNSREWIISALAAIYAGGFATGMYTTSTPKACLYYAENSHANIIVVQDQEQLDKILQIKEKLPLLKAVIQYEGNAKVPEVLSWHEVLKLGSKQGNAALDRVLRTMSINECCTLIYTSGTTGKPKAVMLSHDNLTWTGRMIGRYMGTEYGTERIVSYLPLSHIAAQLLDIYATIAFGATVYFGDKNALKGSLVHTLQEAKPTRFFAVPRVWEKISEKIFFEMNKATGLKKSVVLWAQRVGLQHSMDIMNGNRNVSLQYSLANALIFSKIRKQLGFDRCLGMFNGAAPMSTSIKIDCWSIDLLVMEGFGMSETAGCQALCKEKAFGLESVGPTLPGCFTKVDNPDANGQGELLFKGRNIFMGYINDLPSTESAFNADGWFLSGDIGTVDKDGFVYITGRKKEVVITAGGENIPPVLIENNIKAELPCLSDVVLVGDFRKFLSVLVTMKCERDANSLALDTLDTVALHWCEEIGSNATKVSEVLNDELVHIGIQDGIDRANKNALSRAQRVQKFAILPRGFSISTGELGPTMKMKRNAVLKKYKDIIDTFYVDDKEP